MGKRSDFTRNERDFYPTPYAAVVPLLPHLKRRTYFNEHCAGALDLMRHLESEGHKCVWASDIEPQGPRNIRASVGEISGVLEGSINITNPPWPKKNGRGEPTVSMALHLSDLAPTWFLLSADFAHNVYFGKLAKRCQKIVSVGRVKWIEGSKHTGMDNCAWYLFDKQNDNQTEFYERKAA